MKKETIEKKISGAFVMQEILRLRKHRLEDRTQMRDIQNEGVKRIMKRAYEVPFYRAKFDAANLTPDDFNAWQDLVKFPLTTKEELREWMLSETEKEGWDPDKWVPYSTSGSTGIPLTTYMTPRENAKVVANWVRICMENGYRPAKHSTLALKDERIIKARKNGRDSLLQKFGVGKREVISFESDGETILNELNTRKPDFFYLQRSKLEQMLLYAKRAKKEVWQPKLICVIGENIDARTAEMLDEYFPGTVFSSYGSQETGACTFTRPGRYTHHVITSDTHVVLLLNEEGKLAREGKMVVTNLFIESFPIINYDIGDSAVFTKKNGTLYLKEIYGRKNDNAILEFSDGSSVACYSLYALMEDRRDILQFCFVQDERDHIEVLLAEDPDRAGDRAEVETQIGEGLSRILPEGVGVSFKWVEEILPDANGKRSFVRAFRQPEGSR